MDLMSLTYVSMRRYTKGVDPNEDLRRIHQQSLHNNPRLGITGVLLCTRNHFVQLVEGEEKATLGLFDKIKKDTAHYNVTLRRSVVIDKRQFPNWSMNVVYIESINQALYGISDSSPDANPYHLSSDLLCGLLASTGKQTAAAQTQLV